MESYSYTATSRQMTEMFVSVYLGSKQPREDVESFFSHYISEIAPGKETYLVAICNGMVQIEKAIFSVNQSKIIIPYIQANFDVEDEIVFK